jgi:hypothetical protein
VRYVVARLAAFPNVWWSMANEYDLMPAKRTVTPIPGAFAGTFQIDLPGRPFIAVRLRAVD